MSDKEKTPKTAPAHNPYLAGRQEWNERYGSHIKQANQWKVVAIGALGIAALAVVGVIYLGSRNKFVPYVVEVDKLGTSLGVRKADEAQAVDTRVMRATLAAFVTNVRTVSPDASLQKAMLLQAYGSLSNQDPATTKLNEFFSKNSPFERAQTETVTVEIHSVLPITKETWQIEWSEKVTTRKGQLKEVARWKATGSVYTIPPTTEPQILKNPLGIFLRDFDWAKQI